MCDKTTAIFFDLDGTLIDSLPDLRAAANHLRETYHLPPLEQSLIESFIGDGIINLAARTIAGSHQYSFSDEKIAEYLALFIDYYSAHLLDHTKLYPGVIETLTSLKEKSIKMAVITNKAAKPAETILEALGIRDFFEVVYGGDSFPEKKPSAMPLKNGLAALDVVPEQALMIGDSINDIASGKTARSKTCFVSYGYGRTAQVFAAENGKADYLIHAFPELLDFIK